MVVLIALLGNMRQPWFPLIALGAGLNLLVIVVNGGVMPADPAALASVGLLDRAGQFSNTAPMTGAPLGFLGDTFATPPGLPFANVLSLGDLMIGTGAAAWLATVMRRTPRPRFEGRALTA